jgi:antitoxin CptB
VDRVHTDLVLWRCRRGMKELDVLLERFARQHYGSASPGHRRAFERLLELPDPLLVDLLLGPPGQGALGPDDPAVDRDLAEIAALVAAPGRL